MTDYSGRLRLALQLLDENPESWGSILNQSVFQLLEDSISGVIDIDVTSGNVALTRTDGGNDTARYAILNIIGVPGVVRNVIVPEGTDGGGTASIVDVSKIYLCVDNTTGGFQMTVKTTSGAGVDVPIGKTVWVYSDGTDVINASHALTADTAATATTASDADALGTFAAALYPRLAVANTFTKGQTAARVALTDSLNVTIDASTSNKFFLEPLQSFTLENPTSPVDGQSLSIVFKQGAGGPYTISYGLAWAFQLAVKPALTATVGAYDLLSAEFDADSATWMGAMVKDMRNS